MGSDLAGARAAAAVVQTTDPTTAWTVDVDRPCDNVRPTFADAVPCGLTQAAKDTAGMDGAVDEEDDPAVEVPYPVAQDIAAACGARLPTWQEWEAGARGPDGRLFPWGDDPWVPAIDADVLPLPGGAVGVALLRSFGWLRTAASPLGLHGLCRYGAEWNSVDFDLGDATGGAAARATTHVLRSLADHNVMRPPHRHGAAHRSFTLPCAAAYGLPHKGTHCAAFRIVVPPPQRVARHRGPERPPTIAHDVDLGALAMLLGVSGDEVANRGRVEGLLGPAEAVGAAGRGAGQAEEWAWPSRGCSAEVDPLCGLRVVSVTVYERAYDRPLWSRRFMGAVDGALRFPMTKGDVARAWEGSPAVRRGNCAFYRRRAGDWAWWSSADAGPRVHVGRMRPSKRYDASQPMLARVAHSEQGQVLAITLSLAQ